jgi:hypothetical protein
MIDSGVVRPQGDQPASVFYTFGHPTPMGSPSFSGTLPKPMSRSCLAEKMFGCMGVWQGMAMDSLNFHLGPPCPTLLRPAGGPSLKRPYGCFRDGPPAGRVACGCLLPLCTPHAVRPCLAAKMQEAVEPRFGSVIVGRSKKSP